MENGINVYDVLEERGFIEQVTDDVPIRELLSKKHITCYIGFDPTASSLHIGSLVPIMALVHMQKHGHRPLALVGGGTALIGDPSGKTEMRQILTLEKVQENAAALKKQLSRFIDFDDGGALLLNNADWLKGLNYIEFLRDIGRHFSVNRMLAAESYRQRLERGLNFIEFNYMILQSYDFYYLCKHHDCVLQMGGNDQWGNIVAGIDLTRRMADRKVFGMTFPLLVTAQGNKMGKTEKGTLWLDAELTAPYDYFQYWINVDDADVKRFLALFTFLPMDEIGAVDGLRDSELNMAKAVLAFEATRINHGEKAATAAWQASLDTFGLKPVPGELFPSSAIPREVIAGDVSAIPTFRKSRQELKDGIPAYELFFDVELCASKGEARRLIAQGGGYINDRQLKTFDEKICLQHIDSKGEARLRKGKKKYAVIKIGG